MSVSAKQLKELETKIQDKLYNNIKLLTYIYPTSKDFDAVFKKNMFIKSNKAAFQYVIYYLFNILNPELTKQKITAWPLYDVKFESIFRNEVIVLVNCINAHYEHANIPNLMASHLASPGGLKFMRFMLRLSLLVMYEHLKKNESIGLELLNTVKPHKDTKITNINMKNLKAKAEYIETDIEEKWKKFSKVHEAAALEAQRVVAEQTQIERDLYDANKKLEDKKINRNYTRNKDTLIEKYKNLKEKVAAVEKIKNLCCNGRELLTFLSSDKPVLDFKKDEFVVPNSVKHLSTGYNDELDLHHLFNSLNILMESESLEMPVFTLNQLNEVSKILTDLSGKYAHLDQKLTLRKNELVDLSENFLSGISDTPRAKKMPLFVVPEPEYNSYNT